MKIPRTALAERKNHGFTLIELMVTVALMAILLALATPSFLNFRRNSELIAITNNFVAALNAARTEGMKRNMYAMVVPTNNDNNWSAGWIVFVDINSNGQYNAGDLIVLQQEAPPSYITISGNGTTADNPSYARYDGSGFFRPKASLAAATLSISRSDAGTDYTQIRRIKIAMTGRVRVCTPQSASDANCAATGD